jgi:hypothetical protein
MLSHLPQFCNSFPAHPLPAWQGAWASWRRRGRPHRVTVIWCTLDLASSAPLPRVLQAGHTPLHLSTTHPHGTSTYSPMKYSAASRWRTPCATSVCKHDASARRQQPHARARAATGPYTPACSAAIVQEHRSMVHGWPPRHRVVCLRMTVGHGKSRFTRACRKLTIGCGVHDP